MVAVVRYRYVKKGKYRAGFRLTAISEMLVWPKWLVGDKHEVVQGHLRIRELILVYLFPVGFGMPMSG